jgi:HEPN domain-containing protein
MGWKAIDCLSDIIIKMRKDTTNWIALAEYDLETAYVMLEKGRYIYVIFLCHLSVEKMLKAHISEISQDYPPKTHDLIFLIKKSGLELPQGLIEFIGKINTVSIPTRYPEDLQRILQEYPFFVAKSYLEQTEETLTWLKERFVKS